MISKNVRQRRVVEIVQREQVSSQEELSERRSRAGIRVTESTLSRDIRELGLVKVRGSYQLNGSVNGTPSEDNVRRAFQQMLTQCALSGNILMIRTAPGNAHSLGVVLDAAGWSEILGTVA